MTATQAGAVKGTANIGASTLALTDATGTSDVLSLTMGTGLTTAAATTTGALTVNGFETINIAANAGPTATAANKTSTIASFTADVATKINLTGTAVDLTNLAVTKAATYDGTALTGDGAAASAGLTVAGSAVAASVIKGSEFVDDFTIGATGSTYQGNGGKDVFLSTTEAILSGSVSIDGGAGADTLSMSALAATTATQTIGDTMFGKLANIESVNFTGANAGDFNWTLGGFANTLAGQNGGVLKTTAANFATAVTGDVIAVDASNLTGTNALELTLTNTVGTGAANIATHTFTGGGGNDKFVIDFDKNDASDQSLVTISAGGGNDTITFSMGSGTSTPGTITLTGGAGDDTITGSVEIDTITGGAGNDTLKGNGGADIFVVTTVTDSNASTAGQIDKITDFVGGTDTLKVGSAGNELNAQTLTVGYTGADTIAELNGLLNSTTGTSTAKFDGTGNDVAKLTTNDARILVAVDVDASGTFTAADVVVEMTGLTGTLAFGDVIV
jgi:Ca2+-binding RTX toxin-like protein